MPPNVNRDGGEKGLSTTNQALNHVFCLITENYTIILLSTRLTQVCPKAFLSLDISVLRTQLKVGIFPTECPILALQLVFFELFITIS